MNFHHRPNLLLPLLLITAISYGQPAIEWQKCLGGTANEAAQAVQQTSDGGYIVAGWSTSTDGDVSGNHDGADIWVVRLNATGTIQWQRTLGGSDDDGLGFISDGFVSIKQTSDEGFILGGYTESSDGDVTNHHGNRDAWVVKLSATGTVVWQRCLGGSDEDKANCIGLTSDGGFIVAGYSESTDGDVVGNHDDEDAWLVKLDASGVIEWQKCLGGSSADFGYSVQQTSDGGYILGGNTWSDDGDVSGNHGGPFGLDQDAWVVKTDANGAIEWQRCLGGTGFDYIYSVEQTTDGGYVVAGETDSNDGDVSGLHGTYVDAWVVRLDGSGSIQWQRCLGGWLGDGARSVTQTTDGGFLVTGPTSSNNGDVTSNHGGHDIWAVKLDNTGSIAWQRCLGGGWGDNGYCAQQTVDGGYVVVGETWSNDGDVSGSHGDGTGNTADAWVAKLAPDEVGISEVQSAAFSAFPNPTSGNVTVQSQTDRVITSLDLLDATAHLTFRSTKSTAIPIVLDLEDRKPGLYLLRIHFDDGTTATERIIKE